MCSQCCVCVWSDNVLMAIIAMWWQTCRCLKMSYDYWMLKSFCLISINVRLDYVQSACRLVWMGGNDKQHTHPCLWLMDDGWRWKRVLDDVAVLLVCGMSNRISVITVLHRQLVKNSADLLFTYKLVFGILDMDVSEFFTTQFDDKRRGHCYKLYLPSCKSCVRYNCFSQRVIRFWNVLP